MLGFNIFKGTKGLFSPQAALSDTYPTATFCHAVGTHRYEGPDDCTASSSFLWEKEEETAFSQVSGNINSAETCVINQIPGLEK